MLRTFTLIVGVGICLAAQLIFYNMWNSRTSLHKVGAGLALSASIGRNSTDAMLRWYAPNFTAVNDLSAVLNGNDVFGFFFGGSETPSTMPYSTYNWCNMPHVREQEYVKAHDGYKLEYVEVIHRHHKRTPYASNTFPQESYSWNCDDEALLYYGTPQPENNAAAIGWQVYSSPVNPLVPQGFNGTCQFPQITADGLLDSRRHGMDLYGVYHDRLHFLPDQMDSSKISFRVTNNQITSQVASQVILGMFPGSSHQLTRVLVQPNSIDSLEPTYSCPTSVDLQSSLGVGSNDVQWTSHLTASKTVGLFARLDKVSGVNKSDPQWHNWFDHYFDNLSSRLCHQKPLPCNINDTNLCISRADADAVFRRGEYEYSMIWRDQPGLFDASVASYGIWLAELAANLRNVIEGKANIIYRHNIAHDGSIARLLSILQVDVMVWPGMGSEVVFELYSKDSKWYLRVLWSGQVFVSSNPYLGRMDMLSVDTFLAYIDGLVGIGAKKIPQLCGLS